MSRLSLRILTLAVATLAFSCPAFAQPAAAPDTVLPNRPDTAAAIELDPAFLSTAAGISVRPPAGGKMIRQAGGGDEIVRFVNDQAKWTLVVTRVILSEPVPLTASADAGKTPDPAGPQQKASDPSKPGFAETMASQMPSDTPGQLLRTVF